MSFNLKKNWPHFDNAYFIDVRVMGKKTGLGAKLIIIIKKYVTQYIFLRPCTVKQAEVSRFRNNYMT